MTPTFYLLMLSHRCETHNLGSLFRQFNGDVRSSRSPSGASGNPGIVPAVSPPPKPRGFGRRQKFRFFWFGFMYHPHLNTGTEMDQILPHIDVFSHELHRRTRRETLERQIRFNRIKDALGFIFTGPTPWKAAQSNRIFAGRYHAPIREVLAMSIFR